MPLVGVLLLISSDDEPFRPGNEAGTLSQIRPIGVPLSVWAIEGAGVAARAEPPGTGVSEGPTETGLDASMACVSTGPPQAVTNAAMESTTAGTSAGRYPMREGNAAARRCGEVTAAS